MYAGIFQADSAEGADLLLPGGQELYCGQETEESLPILQVTFLTSVSDPKRFISDRDPT